MRDMPSRLSAAPSGRRRLVSRLHPFLAEYDPFLEDVRGEPGFRKLLDEVRPRWDAVVAWERRRGA